MVGMLILAIAGISWITLMGQTAHSVHQIRLREADYRAAADDLEHVSLWTSDQLSAISGPARVGSFVLLVQPITSELFEVALTDTVGATLLTTSIYAPAHVDTLSP